MNQTIDIERIKQQIPIETLIAQSFTVTGKGHTLTTAEHDSLKIFTSNNSWTWYSQAGHNGNALGGSVIDWYMHMHGCSNGEAIRALGAMLDGGAVPAMPTPRTVAKQFVDKYEWKTPKWQSTARRQLAAGQAALLDIDNPAGEPGRAYLAERGISLEMAIAFGLGYGEVRNFAANRDMPALLLPWMNQQITYIMARFIGVSKGDSTADRTLPVIGVYLNPQDKNRFWGTRYMFGLQHCVNAGPGDLGTLFVVEGELNAVSIFQTVYGRYACDVISFGPQSNIGDHNRRKIAGVATRYRRVIVWADEPEIALKALDTLPQAMPVQSPRIDGKRRDANDFLQSGCLDDVLFDLIRMAK